MAQVLGTFSKAIDGSVSLNFSVSGGANCSKRCNLHPENPRSEAAGRCYAVVVEARADRVQLKDKLERHQQMPASRVCGMALLELQRLEERGKLPPWFRFSSAGSLPMPGRASPVFIRQLRALVRWLVDRGVKIHLPLESPSKVAFYREAIGDLVTIRESLQAPGSHLTTDGAVSAVAGSDITTGGNIRERRIEAARTMAAERREATGRKTIVCPAVVAGFRLKTAQARASAAQRAGRNAAPLLAILDQKREAAGRSKCGGCVACSLSDCDVIYPAH